MKFCIYLIKEISSCIFVNFHFIIQNVGSFYIWKSFHLIHKSFQLVIFSIIKGCFGSCFRTNDYNREPFFGKFQNFCCAIIIQHFLENYKRSVSCSLKSSGFFIIIYIFIKQKVRTKIVIGISIVLKFSRTIDNALMSQLPVHAVLCETSILTAGFHTLRPTIVNKSNICPGFSFLQEFLNTTDVSIKFIVISGSRLTRSPTIECGTSAEAGHISWPVVVAITIISSPDMPYNSLESYCILHINVV